MLAWLPGALGMESLSTSFCPGPRSGLGVVVMTFERDIC